LFSSISLHYSLKKAFYLSLIFSGNLPSVGCIFPFLLCLSLLFFSQLFVGNLKNNRMISVCFQSKPFSITEIQVYALTTNTKEDEVELFCEDLQDLLELTPKKDALFIIGDWNAKVGSQDIPGVMGKFGLRVQNEAGQRLTEFCQKNTLVIAKKPSSNNIREDSTHGHHQMVNTEIRLIVFFAAKDGEALQS